MALNQLSGSLLQGDSMTGLHRTPLTTSDKIGLAAKALLSEAYGAVTALSEEYEVSRPTVYRAREGASDVLKTHFEAPPEEDGVVYVRVDRAQLERAVVGARMEAPCSIRDIES
jgi:hypothetical protein